MVQRPLTPMRDERGSIPLSLLAVAIVSTISIALVGSTLAETRATRFDQGYSLVVHAAASAVDEAVFKLNNDLITSSPATGSGTFDGVRYRWTATQEPSPNQGTWVIDAVGGGDDATGPNRVERALRATVVEEPLFAVAAHTQVTTAFSGSNSADSYNSTDGSRCSMPAINGSDRVASVDCFGIVGTNGNVDVSGTSSGRVDRILIYDWLNPAKPQADRCTGTGSTVVCAPPVRTNFDEPKRFVDIHDQVTAALNSCPAADRDRVWVASLHGGPSGGAVAQNARATFGFDPGVHCFKRIVFDRHTDLRNSVSSQDGQQLLVYITEGVEIALGREVGCNGCTANGSTQTPAAGRLNIFSIASDRSTNPKEVVRIQNQVAFVGTIFAPNGTCGIVSNGANAGTHVFGSMICQDIRNNGGWQFHYDEQLQGGLRTGEFFVQRLDEEIAP